MSKQPYPYAHAPRLAPEGPIDVADLVSSTSGPVEIEIGPGRGMFLLERVQEARGSRVVGLEIRWKWATIVDERLAKQGFGERARVYAEDAKRLLPRLTPDESVDIFYVHFPDPWWKKRQQKRLVVVPSFVKQMVRLLKPGGLLFVQTDVEERAQAYEAVLDAAEGLEPAGDEPGSAQLVETSWTSKSNREKRVQEAGLQPVRLLYRKVSAGA